MLYAILFLIALLLVVYFGGRWILAEMREASGAIGTRLKIVTGGLTSDHLLEQTRRTLADRGLEADCIVLAAPVTPVYDALRRAVLGHPVERPLPAALVLALAADVDAGMLYLRAVEAPRAQARGRERACFHAFADVDSIRRVANAFPGSVSPPGDDALELTVSGRQDGRYHLVLGPDLGVSPDDLVERVRAMVADGEKPAGAPVVVR